MGTWREIWRGTKASTCWVVGVPLVNWRMVRKAQDKREVRESMAAHSGRFLERCGVEVEILGVPPEPGVGCVLCYNETSFVDVMAFTKHMWPHVDRAAAADLYAWFPFARDVFKMADIEMVPRGNRQGTDKLIKKMVLAARDGNRIAWGGEGRLSGIDGVLRFKVGASLIAIRAAVPIVPVAYHGGHQILPLGSLRARTGIVRVRFGEPIPTSGYSEENARDLATRVQAVVAGMYAELDAVG